MRYITTRETINSLAQGVQRIAEQWTAKYPKAIQKKDSQPMPK